MTTSYDEVAYPVSLFSMTHPERLAVFATLHGLSPAPADTARVLEIGCGEGYNLMGLAAAYPRAQLDGFDLAETAIAKGKARVAAAGLDNVSLWVGNILDAKDTIAAGGYDYVVAHGIYAWVPEAVRDAVMDLAGHALAPHGVFYVSYNALPGGYFRMVMRDFLLHELHGISDPTERMATTRRVLEDVAKSDPQRGVTIQALRTMAEALLEKNQRVLFHDELGDVYAPQSLSDVAANAARAGLRYLTDADYSRLYEGFVEDGIDADGDPEEADRLLLRKAQSRNYRNTAFFHCSLFVRADAPIKRTLDLSLLDPLLASTTLRYDAQACEFSGSDTRVVRFADDAMTAAFHKLVAAQPGRIALSEILEVEDWRGAFLTMLSKGLIDLHTGRAPFATTIGDRPQTSRFARFMIEQGAEKIPRLDHGEVKVEQDALRAVLVAANGERTIAEIARAVDGVFAPEGIEPALNAAATIALMVR